MSEETVGEFVEEEAVVRYDELMSRHGDRERVLAVLAEEYPKISEARMEEITIFDHDDDYFSDDDRVFDDNDAHEFSVVVAVPVAVTDFADASSAADHALSAVQPGRFNPKVRDVIRHGDSWQVHLADTVEEWDEETAAEVALDALPDDAQIISCSMFE